MPLLTGIFASAISGRLTPADAGSMFPLGTFTLSGQQASIDFTNIPQTYTHLQIRGTAKGTQPGGPHSLRVQFNNDTGSNYTYHAVLGDGASVSAGSIISLTSQFPGFVMGTSGTNVFGSFVIDILDYRNTNKNTTTRCLSGADVNGSGNAGFFSGLWLNPAAVTSIKLLPAVSTNFVANTSISLYGVL